MYMDEINGIIRRNRTEKRSVFTKKKKIPPKYLSTEQHICNSISSFLEQTKAAIFEIITRVCFLGSFLSVQSYFVRLRGSFRTVFRRMWMTVRILGSVLEMGYYLFFFYFIIKTREPIRSG